jgi:hypothetical protein
MLLNASEFLKLTYRPDCPYCKMSSYNVRERVLCADGFSVSIQGNSGMYCSPRENIAVYEAVELGYPSALDELINEYAEQTDEDGNATTETVFPYVPIEVVEALIAKHGGIVGTIPKEESA